jgi:hypothetical protein
MYLKKPGLRLCRQGWDGLESRELGGTAVMRRIAGVLGWNLKLLVETLFDSTLLATTPLH